MKLLLSACIALAILIAGFFAAITLRDTPDDGSRAAPGPVPAPPADPEPRAPGAGDAKLPVGSDRPPRPQPAAPGGRAPVADELSPDAGPGIAPGDAEIVFIVSRAGGGPLRGARVTLLSGRSSASSATDTGGLAAFPGIAPDVYSFRLESSLAPVLTGAKEISLAAGERREVPLEVGDFDASIHGRVFDRTGNPVEGILIEARRHVFDAPDNVLVPLAGGVSQATSEPDGEYELPGLGEGDYLVSTARTGPYPPVRKIFRSGTAAADIVLDAARELAVGGVVKTRSGEPIAGAAVVPLAQPERKAETDAAGRYDTTLSMTEGQTVHLITAMKKGYRDARVQFRSEEVGESPSLEIDIPMDAVGVRAPVKGVVQDSAGLPISNESVFLHSATLGARYQALTGEDGRFSLGDVEVGDEYRLWIYPRSTYRDHSVEKLAVPEEGLDIAITLEPYEAAALRGVMVDPGGRPVPRFTLWLRSMKALGNSVAVTGDAKGAFEVAGVPEGEILFETRSLPRFTIRGFELSSAVDAAVTLVVDHGAHTLSGSIVNEGGAPVAGAAVSLHWSHAAEGVQSTSFRSTVSDAGGRFSFGDLAAGEHKLSVNAPGHGPSYTSHDVGGGGPDPLIELKAR